MKNNKYEYLQIIQQNYGQGWEDVSEYEADSTGTTKEMSGSFKTLKDGRKREIKLITHDLNEYRRLGYATRIISRKTLKATQPQ